MRVLVTGASGFLGSHVARRCLLRGDQVRALVRPPSQASFSLRHDALEVVPGDITDAARVRDACEGVDAVIHAAAKVTDWGDPQEFHRVNVLGTRAVLDACAAAAVERLVHISTPSVVFDGRGQRDVDETTPYPARFASAYAQSKAVAEQAVRARSESASTATVILRPRAIWGPGDTQGYFPRLMKRAVRGRLPRLSAATEPLVDFCHVDNAVQACLLALVSDAAVGRTYFITDGKPVLLWAWIDALCDTFELPRPRRRLPTTVALAAATVAEATWRATGLMRVREPPLTRYAVQLFSSSSTFCIDAARRDLGYEPDQDSARGLRELKSWVDRQGGIEKLVSASVDEIRSATFAMDQPDGDGQDHEIV